MKKKRKLSIHHISTTNKNNFCIDRLLFSRGVQKRCFPLNISEKKNIDVCLLFG
jgi:hypothetical protein